MADGNTGANNSATEETNSQSQEPKFEAITSQEDFDKAIQARLARERAKFQGFDQFKADSAELAKLRDSQKTDEQKQQDTLRQVQEELAQERSARLRAEVASTKGVPASLLTGGTKEELEDSADALIQFRGESGGKKLHLPNEGKNPSSRQGDSVGEEFVNELFGRDE